MEIGQKLKNRRKELGLTMLQVATKVGVSEATVSRWESGDIANMRRDKIVLLANALQVSPSYIMGDGELPYTESHLHFNIGTNTLRFDIAYRLRQIMQERNLRQVDILSLAKPYCQLHRVKLGRNDLSQYLSGKAKPGQTKLFVLACALNVNEAWLMGFDVSRERTDDNSSDNSASTNDNIALSTRELALINKYNKLNTSGKDKTDTYIDDLLENRKYTDKIVEIEKQGDIISGVAALGGNSSNAAVSSEDDSEASDHIY